MVLGSGVSGKPIAEFLGAEFRSAADRNGHVLIPYGGTRTPQAPPGVNPNRRQVSNRPKEQITGAYRQGYGESYRALKERFPVNATRLVCNQMSPQIVGMLGDVLDMKDRVVTTGPQTGHLGGSDIIEAAVVLFIEFFRKRLGLRERDSDMRKEGEDDGARESR